MTDHGLFRAKVNIPARRDSALPRPRLTTPLADLPAGHIGVIQAPAGYGKTTLAADAARQSGCTVWWLSLDEFDRDSSTFLRYLSLAAGLGPPGADTHSASGRELLGRICGSGDPARQVCLVLDDVHGLNGTSDSSGLIDYLALRMPENFRLILASRTAPDLASIARLRVQGRVLELGLEALAFTEEEITSLRDTIGGQPSSRVETKTVLEKTGGWPVAVSVMVADSKLPPNALSSFISSEILQRLPPELGDFITRASVLETLDASSCDYLLRRSDSGSTLDLIERQNVPIMKLGSPPEYRVHAVVRSYLQDELKALQPQVHRDLHIRAAEWLIEAGLPESAISHLAEAGDWERVSEAITKQTPAAYKEGRWHAVTNWLGMLPDEIRQRQAPLTVWESRILIRFGRADDALQEIEACRQKCSSIAPEVMAELEALCAAAFRIKGDFDSAVVSARRALDLAVTENAPLSVVAESHKQLGMALFSRGSFADSASELTAARDIADRRGDREESAVCNACLGSAMDSLGRFAEASVYLERACELWRQVGNTKELSWTLNNLAMTHFQSGQIVTARELFLEAIVKARESDYRRAETYATASLADLDRFAGDLSSAQREYEESLKLAGEVSEPSIQTHLLAGLSDVQRRQGDVAAAEASATKALVNARSRHSGFEEGVARLALARVHRHRGDLKDALAESTQAQECLSAAGPSREQMEALLLLGSVLLESRRHRSELVEALSKLADIVGRTGLGDLLAQTGQPYRPLFEYAASRRVAGRFYHDLIRNLGSSESPNTGDSGAYPTVEIRSFGGFVVTVDGRKVLDAEWESDKSKELLLLLLVREAALSRDEIIATLWPDAVGSKVNSVFHSSLYRLRRALYHGAVIQTSGAYTLNREGVFRWDVARFRQLVGTLDPVHPLSDGSPVENLHAAAELYAGPLAPEFDSEWIDDLRADLETLYIDAMSRLTDHLLERGDGNGAFKVATDLLASDQFSELACRRMMQSAAACGRLEFALKVYERFVSVLRNELGEAPSPALAELARSLTSKATSSP